MPSTSAPFEHSAMPDVNSNTTQYEGQQYN